MARLTRCAITCPSSHSLAGPCSLDTTYRLMAGSGSQIILGWHLLDTPLLRQFFQMGGDILLSTAPQSCGQVGRIDVSGNRFYRASSLAQCGKDLLFALLSMVDVPPHELRPSWRWHHRAMARADGLMC